MKTVLLAIAAALFFAHVAFAGPPDTPFPLDYPIKFPWSSIEGIWQIASTKTDSTFSFEVQSDCQGRQILKVYQIDPHSNTIVAEGTGYRSDVSMEVYAAMKGRAGQNYFLHIGAYKDRSNPQRHAVVLRVFSFDGSPASEQDFVINRLPGSVPVKDELNEGSPQPCPGRFPSN